MSLINFKISDELTKYQKPVAELAQEALKLSEKLKDVRSIAEQLNAFSRKLVKE